MGTIGAATKVMLVTNFDGQIVDRLDAKRTRFEHALDLKRTTIARRMVHKIDRFGRAIGRVIGF